MNQFNAGAILKYYYAATAMFLVLDLAVGVNLRLAFLADLPTLRIAWYGFCFGCFALMIWRPDWSAIVGGFESLLALAALIIDVGMRALLSAESVVDGGDLLTLQQVVNFLLAASMAYIAWIRGITALFRPSSGK